MLCGADTATDIFVLVTLPAPSAAYPRRGNSTASAASQRRCRGKLTCWVVARQYSAVLRMLQMRQSSSKVNFATSDPSFSFSKLVMVSPPLLLVVLGKKKRQYF